MTTTTTSQASPSEHGRQLLEALGQSVSKALDAKRRLGHYAVTWQNGNAVYSTAPDDSVAALLGELKACLSASGMPSALTPTGKAAKPPCAS
jgi:hypothetical protein